MSEIEEFEEWCEENYGYPSHNLCFLNGIELKKAWQACAERKDAEFCDIEELNKSLSNLLEKTAIAIRGEQPEKTLHSFHDIPDRAAACLALIELQANIIKQQAAELAALRGFASDILLGIYNCNEVHSSYIIYKALQYNLHDDSGNPTKLLTGEE